jgi:hypothetical protein
LDVWIEIQDGSHRCGNFNKILFLRNQLIDKVVAKLVSYFHGTQNPVLNKYL